MGTSSNRNMGMDNFLMGQKYIPESILCLGIFHINSSNMKRPVSNNKKSFNRNRFVCALSVNLRSTFVSCNRDDILQVCTTYHISKRNTFLGYVKANIKHSNRNNCDHFSDRRHLQHRRISQVEIAKIIDRPLPDVLVLFAC